MAASTKYWDDLEIGDRFETMGRTVTETDLVNYLALSAEGGQLFSNADYAVEHGPFKKRIVPGLLTVTLALGLHGLLGWSRDIQVIFRAVDQIRFIAPVGLNDTIYSTVEVVEKVLFRHGDRGIVALLHTVHDSTLRPYVEFTTRWQMPLREPRRPES
ncbi:MAG TPA: MaoC/PaaZ C-terminal domain-containing protein [Dehalococcoidia bacterium]|nr:MaoC/PaaZ C-terminal domain-containing protein [Dehalococcoidia bacterium]